MDTPWRQSPARVKIGGSRDGRLRSRDRPGGTATSASSRGRAAEVAVQEEEGTTETSIWCDEWESLGEEEWEGARARRLPRTERLGATLYELDPGRDNGYYHFHHGADELLVVLRGRPVLRTPEGERELEEGEVVVFPAGPAGAHLLSNRTDQPVRFLFASTRPSPEVVEYPEHGQITAQAFTASQTGERLWLLHQIEADTP